jgi:hypothetical protein
MQCLSYLHLLSFLAMLEVEPIVEQDYLYFEIDNQIHVWEQQENYLWCYKNPE